ncbi:MAG: peroxiredoxin [Phycisphaeraceae bacterium]|nr:peroxiredoxin [Phycisphaeraceae bacterium]
MTTAASAGRPIGVGDSAPDFVLPDQHGRMVQFSDLRRAGGREAPVVLFFYPRNFTPGCTREACAFRDEYEQFTEAGALVVGISGDDAESHARFAAMLRLPFTLLSDSGGEVRRLFGVPASLVLFPGRVTYVIDARGVVVMVFNSQFRPGEHVRRALDALRRPPETAAKVHQSRQR